MEIQYSLFDDVAKIRSLRAVDEAIDSVNELYGKHAVHLGTSLWLSQRRQHLQARGDLAKRKLELLPGETFRQRLSIPIWGVKV